MRDHRLAGAEGRDERGGDAGDARRHLEAGGLQLLLQQRAALLLLIADFGEAPDLLGDAGVFVALRVDAAEQRRAVVGRRRLRADTGRPVPSTSRRNRQQQRIAGFRAHQGALLVR